MHTTVMKAEISKTIETHTFVLVFSQRLRVRSPNEHLDPQN